MATVTIREKVHNYLEVADDKKVRVIYALVEDEINNDALEYPEELKVQLDAAEEYYNSGGKMVMQAEMQHRLKKVLKTAKRV